MRIGDFLCFAGTNFYDLDRAVFLAGNYFCDFQKVPSTRVDNIFCILVLSENVQQKYIFSNKKTSISLPFFYTVLFLNERDKL